MNKNEEQSTWKWKKTDGRGSAAAADDREKNAGGEGVKFIRVFKLGKNFFRVLDVH